MENANPALPILIVIIAAILGILLIVLAILWLIFPWFVHAKLSAIERHAQASAKSLEAVLVTINASHTVLVAMEQETRSLADRRVSTTTLTPPTSQ
jgi:hypothetical protein